MKKKCPDCLTCFHVVWVDNKRYYHCWLCQTFYGGLDSELQLVQNPYLGRNEPIILEEQDDNNNTTSDI